MTVVVLDTKFVYVSVVMKVAQKDLQHDLFVASNFEHTPRITRWMYYTYLIFLHDLHHLNSLVPVTTRASVLFLSQFKFCTCHFFTSLLTWSTLPNPFPQLAPLRAPKSWKSQEARSGLDGGWGRATHLRFVVVSCIFRLV